MKSTINAHKILVGKHKGNRPLATSRRGLEENTKMYLKEIECEDMD
jgi:hypothetical protein